MKLSDAQAALLKFLETAEFHRPPIGSIQAHMQIVRGRYDPTTLPALKNDGCISIDGDPREPRYSITQHGKTRLREWEGQQK